MIMELGKRIDTSMGELLILDIQESYLILFDDAGQKFIKANGYDKDQQGKYYWNGGEYYQNFTDLVAALEG